METSETRRLNLWPLFTILVALIMGGAMYWYADSQQQKIDELSEQVEMLNAEAATLKQENAKLENNYAEEKRLHELWFDKYSKLRKVIYGGVKGELYLINYGMSFATRQDLINALCTIDNLLEIDEIGNGYYNNAQKERFEKKITAHTLQYIKDLAAMSED